MRATVFLFVSLVVCLAARANAACTSDLKTHVALGMSFLQEAKAYEARNEKELASAEWENVGHQVELIGGATSPEILSCDDATLNREFYLIASWDEFVQILAATHSNPVPPERARAFRQLVHIFYTFDGAKYYRQDYLTLKSYVHEVDDLASVPYCSPEQSDKACHVMQGRCPIVERASSILSDADPEYPSWAKEILNPVGGTFTTEVTVSLDEHGKVKSATLSRSAKTYQTGQAAAALAALDDAALKAAWASTYRPQIRQCKSVPSSLIFSSSFEATGQ